MKLTPEERLLNAIFGSSEKKSVNIRIKVRGGTTSSDGNLCSSCRYGHAMRFSSNQDVMLCSLQNNEVVKGRVVECNKYRNAAQPSLADMEEIAWRIVTERKGGAAGFVSASKFRKLVDEGRVDNDSLRHDDYD